MIEGGPSTYDNATNKKSFFEIDFDKLLNTLAKKTNNPSNKSPITYGSLKSETQRVLIKNLKALNKKLVPEVLLIENKHLLGFFKNVIKFTEIEDLYLMEMHNSDYHVQMSPNILYSVQRFNTLISDIHLMYCYVDQKKGQEFKEVRDLLDHIINSMKSSFYSLIAEYQKASPKDRSSINLLDHLKQLNVHLDQFDKVSDHKEYKKTCSAENSRAYHGDHSTLKSSTLAHLRAEKERNDYNLSDNNSFRIDDKSLRSDLSTESNSIRSFIRERKMMMGQGKVQGFAYSRISNDSSDTTHNSLLSSPALQRNGSEVADKDRTVTSVEYVKNTNIYARLLGDLKQYRELKGLKLINETPVFPKVEDEETRKTESPLKHRIIKTREEEEENVNPFDIIDVEDTGKIQPDIRSSKLEKSKTQSDVQRKEEEKKNQTAEHPKSSFQEKSVNLERSLNFLDKSNIVHSFQDFEMEYEIDKLLKEGQKLKIQKSEASIRKENEEDHNFLTLPTIQSNLDLSPALKKNASSSPQPGKWEYQRPPIDYLEKSEKVYERKGSFSQQDVDDYIFKKGYAGSNRRRFLTKLFGDKARQKIYDELNDVYLFSPIKSSKDNNELKEELLNKLNEGLENKRIKKLAKGCASKESVFFLLKKRLVVLGEKDKCEETSPKRKVKTQTRAQQLWKKLSYAVRIWLSINKVTKKENALIDYNEKINVSARLLRYLKYQFERMFQDGNFRLTRIPHIKGGVALDRLVRFKETDRILNSFQGYFVRVNCQVEKTNI